MSKQPDQPASSRELNAADKQMASGGVAIRNLDDVRRLSLIFVKSGMFKSDKNATSEEKMYQAGVKIMAGQELGLPPFAAMNSINIIEGRPEMSANLMASLVKKHDRYEYKITRWDRKGCTVEITERVDGRTQTLGEFTFEEQDAKDAGLTGKDNWRKYAKAMYFSRAISAAVRAYAPDVFFGIPTYVPGELSEEVSQEPLQAEQPDDAPESAALPASDPAEEAEPEPELPEIEVNEQLKADIESMLGELKATPKQRIDILKQATGQTTMPKSDKDWIKLYKLVSKLRPSQAEESEVKS